MQQQVVAAKQNSQPKVPKEELPAPYQDSVEASVRYHSTEYNRVAAERDRLRDKVFDLECKLGAANEVIEQKESQINHAESLVEIMRLERDRAFVISERLKTVCGVIQASLRAYEIANEPLIVSSEGGGDEQQPD